MHSTGTGLGPAPGVANGDVRTAPTEGNPRQSDYDRSRCAVFRKTHEAFGGLSNMASGFPLWVNDTEVLTSEALYQACRFPHLPAVQHAIIAERSPMAAKMKSKPHRAQSRADWPQVQVAIMHWCLRVKLAQNPVAFGDLLESTGDRPIVEDSARDAFWGAKPQGPDRLIGGNVLGNLLMDLRDELRRTGVAEIVEPPQIDQFLLYGAPIGPVGRRPAGSRRLQAAQVTGTARSKPAPARCELCGAALEAGTPCKVCGRVRCPACDSCRCQSQAPKAAERRCEVCCLIKRAALFPPVGAVCLDCS